MSATKSVTGTTPTRDPMNHGDGDSEVTRPMTPGVAMNRTPGQVGGDGDADEEREAMQSAKAASPATGGAYVVPCDALLRFEKVRAILDRASAPF